MSYAKFNNEEVINKELEPLMKELTKLCRRYKVPMFVTLGKRGDDNDTVYLSDFNLPQSCYKEPLKRDYVTEHIKIANNFKAYLPLEEKEALNKKEDSENE